MPVQLSSGSKFTKNQEVEAPDGRFYAKRMSSFLMKLKVTVPGKTIFWSGMPYNKDCPQTQTRLSGTMQPSLHGNHFVRSNTGGPAKGCLLNGVRLVQKPLLMKALWSLKISAAGSPTWPPASVVIL